VTAMGRSASVKWQVHNYDKGSYLVYSQGMGFFLLLNGKNTENLHSIVHEINECEILAILRTMDCEDLVIDITKKMCKKYPWLFNYPQRHICLTHLVSPYGKGNCIMGRDKHRLKW
jgi:hypothetical protein